MENVNVEKKLFCFLLLRCCLTRRHEKLHWWHFSHYFVANRFNSKYYNFFLGCFLRFLFFSWFHWTQFLLLAISQCQFLRRMWTDAGQRNFISIQIFGLFTKNDPLDVLIQNDNGSYFLQSVFRLNRWLMPFRFIKLLPFRTT